ncbi:MAG: type II toxin-antitoxin system PemK/MazF family toxin [Desulfamplus sp.]|nr:type II toxin-antitoxin system PemK/MazF family toxin [Desulfamplus sp.]
MYLVIVGVFYNKTFISTSDSGLKKDSIILCHQIRTLDKARLIKKIGEVTDSITQKQIRVLQTIQQFYRYIFVP